MCQSEEVDQVRVYQLVSAEAKFRAGYKKHRYRVIAFFVAVITNCANMTHKTVRLNR